MRFEDERYVRLYTRDTMTWLTWSWQARALFGPLLRKLDRAGLLEMGDHGEEGLAVMVGLPVEVVVPGLADLLKAKTVSLSGTTLIMQRYLEAQECSQSDALRKRESRSRARDLSAAESRTVPVASAIVTNGHAPGPNVTVGHDASQSVTDGHSVPSRAVPSVPNHKEQTHVDPAGATSAVVRAVFDHWAMAQSELTGARVASLKLTVDRRGKIQARLREGYGPDDLRRAIDGMFATDFNVTKRFTDVALACRDAQHVDRFVAAAADGAGDEPDDFFVAPPADPNAAPPAPPAPAADHDDLFSRAGARVLGGPQ